MPRYPIQTPSRYALITSFSLLILQFLQFSNQHLVSAQPATETFRTHALSSLPTNATIAALTVDNDGNLFIAGQLMQNHSKAPAIFVAKLSPDPNIEWFTLPFNDSAVSFAPASNLIHDGRTLVVAGAAILSASQSPVVPVAVAAALSVHTGAHVWSTPLRLSSQGSCAIHTLIHNHRKLYVAGHLTGSILYTQPNSSAAPSSPPPAQQFEDKETDKDAFVAIIDIETGSIHRVLQLPLNLDNSADALIFVDDILYVAVNSGPGTAGCATHQDSRTSIFTIHPNNFSFHPLRFSDTSRTTAYHIVSLVTSGDQSQSPSLTIVSCGITPKMNSVASISHVDLAQHRIVWRETLGQVPPGARVSAVSLKPYVLVSGFVEGARMFRRGAENQLWAIRQPLRLFDSLGISTHSWNHVSIVPHAVSTICCLHVVDNLVIYAGGWKEWFDWKPAVGWFVLPTIESIKSQSSAQRPLGPAQAVSYMPQTQYRALSSLPSPVGAEFIMAALLTTVCLGAAICLVYRMGTCTGFSSRSNAAHDPLDYDSETDAEILLYKRDNVFRRYGGTGTRTHEASGNTLSITRSEPRGDTILM